MTGIIENIGINERRAATSEVTQSYDLPDGMRLEGDDVTFRLEDKLTGNWWHVVVWRDYIEENLGIPSDSTRYDHLDVAYQRRGQIIGIARNKIAAGIATGHIRPRTTVTIRRGDRG